MKIALFLSILSLGLAVSPITRDSSAPSLKATNLCSSCVSFADDSLSILYNKVVNNYIIADCKGLCDELSSEIGKIFCKSLCEYVGIKAFTDAILSADLDPIYFCQVVGQCPVVDGGNITVTSATVTPTSALLGAEFSININFQVISRTGTGNIKVTVQPPAPYDALVMDTLNTGFAIGPITQTFNVKSSGPIDDLGDKFVAGNYAVAIEICSGTCGSKHAHAFLLGSANTSFTITNT